MAEKLPDGEGQDTYQAPADGWVCFHCGVRFRKYGEALEHFGKEPVSARIAEFVELILHGNAQYQQWLREAGRQFLRDGTVPPSEGG